MPSMTVASGATFAKLTGERFGPASGGGIRGRVNGFTRESRKRLLDWLNTVQASAVSSGLFLTLTYPDMFPESPVRWKRDLDVFLKRLRRRYPGVVAIWRLEQVPRKSGVNVGLLAPHFHALLLNTPPVDIPWLGRAWYDTVRKDCEIGGEFYQGIQDEKHLGVGTSVQRIRSRRGIVHYCAKYIGKLEEQVSGSWTGRVWGIIGRELLPVVLVVYELTWRQFYKVRRVLRAWLTRATGRRWKRLARLRGQGMTAYITDDTARRLLVWTATA